MDEELLFNYIEAKFRLALAKDELAAAERLLMESMEDDQRKSVKVDTPNKQFQITYVRATRYNVNEKGLRRALKAKVYDKYTKKTLDRSALEKAMETGEVDPMVVSQYLSEVPGTPYLKLTEKDSE